MKGTHRSTKRPIEEVAVARAFYAGLSQDVSYFSALWHTFNVGHILTIDLDRICRQYDLSIADFNLMGALRTSMATCGYESVKEFQKAEVMVAPALQTEGKALQRTQGVGMGH